jgi:co-chaperonin GroES (HSP10)
MKKEKTFRAANNWILVDDLPPEREEIIGAIAVFNSDKEAAQNAGIVMSVGPDCDQDLQPGDTVIYGDWGGSKAKINKKLYKAIRCSDVISIGR